MSVNHYPGIIRESLRQRVGGARRTDRPPTTAGQLAGRPRYHPSLFCNTYTVQVMG